MDSHNENITKTALDYYTLKSQPATTNEKNTGRQLFPPWHFLRSGQKLFTQLSLRHCNCLRLSQSNTSTSWFLRLASEIWKDRASERLWFYCNYIHTHKSYKYRKYVVNATNWFHYPSFGPFVWYHFCTPPNKDSKMQWCHRGWNISPDIARNVDGSQSKIDG